MVSPGAALVYIFLAVVAAAIDGGHVVCASSAVGNFGASLSSPVSVYPAGKAEGQIYVVFKLKCEESLRVTPSAPGIVFDPPSASCSVGEDSAGPFLLSASRDAVPGDYFAHFRFSNGAEERDTEIRIHILPMRQVCPAGRYGTVSNGCNPCGGGNMHFCPEATTKVKEVREAYYSVGGQPGERHAEEICPIGSYCTNGERFDCPAGRYGGRVGLLNKTCSGLCSAGYYCPSGSTSPRMKQCNSDDVYCPEGSKEPTPVAPGHFSVSRVSQEICKEGFYCTSGKAFACPAGRYGKSRGLKSSECDGPCRAGYFCRELSNDPQQNACGSANVFCEAGSAMPKPVHQGYYSIGGIDEAHRVDERICPFGHWCHEGIRRQCPAGRYGGELRLSTSACSGNCSEGFYCPAASKSRVEEECGDPHVYCPAASPKPTPVPVGYFSLTGKTIGRFEHVEIHPVDDEENDRFSGRKFKIFQDPDPNMTIRDRIEICPKGMYCNRGVRYLCPAGRYGAVEGEVSSQCSGPSSMGYFAPPGSISANQYPCGGIGLYCPEGSSSPYPVQPGYYTFSPASRLYNTSTECHFNNSECLPVFPYDALYYRKYNNRDGESVRTEQIICPPGSYCVDGKRWEMPPGRYGKALGTVSVTAIMETGICKRGWYCPAASVSSTPIRCGASNKYCPEGSGSPTPVPEGWYTAMGLLYTAEVTDINVDVYMETSGRHQDDDIKYEIAECEVGHWCSGGLRNACPSGRYGSTRGLSSPFCSGPCAAGFICPRGSFRSTQQVCGFGIANPSSVFCPTGVSTGSFTPTPVSKGHYTIGGSDTLNTTRSNETICPIGHYCEEGKMIRCPAGRYGSTTGLNNASCSGACAEGYFCPSGSIDAQQVRCGSDRGVRSPCKIYPDGRTAQDFRTGEMRCEVGHGAEDSGHRKTLHDFGGGWETVVHHKTEEYTGMVPRQYHYHTSFHTRSRTRFTGHPASVFCPTGSEVPTSVKVGYYTSGGNNTDNKTRVTQIKCEPGFFCEDGMKFRCPPGHYGKEFGLATEKCSGYCPAGFYCPWNTSTPIECPPRTYSSPGYLACIKCPRPETIKYVDECRDGRHCCFR